MQIDYRLMNSPELVAALDRLARHPHLYDNAVERKASITAELIARAYEPATAPIVPIIILESDTENNQ